MTVAYDLYDNKTLRGFKKVQLIDNDKIIAQCFIANKFFEKDYLTLTNAIKKAFVKFKLTSWKYIPYTL